MLLENSYKKRLGKLAGIISEDTIKLVTSDAGRSDNGTLSWYVEEYLLNLTTNIINQLSVVIEGEQNLLISISQSSTKISSNSLMIRFVISGNINNNNIKEDVSLLLSVNLESSSNTTCAITNKSITNKVTLTSKHSSADIETFIADIINNVSNVTIPSQEQN